VKAIVFGYRDLAIAGLKALLRAGVEVAQIYSHEEDPEDRQFYPSLTARAAELNVPISTAVDVASPQIGTEILAAAPGLLFNFDYQLPLGRKLLALPGLHELQLSLLPAYDAPQSIVRALIAGEKKIGLTLRRLAPSPADAVIIDQAELFIARQDTHLTLYRKLAALAGPMLDRALPLIQTGTAPARPMPPAGAPQAPIDPRLDWAKSSWDAYNKIRALTRPHPGAVTTFLHDKMKIWRAEPDDRVPAVIHSRELQIDEGRALAGFSSGALRLDEISWRGRTLAGPEIASALAPFEQETFEG
jgi:methionyl-tRNA formyltransferase